MEILFLLIIIAIIIAFIVSSNNKESYYAPGSEASYYKTNTYVPTNSNPCYKKPPMPPCTAQYINGAAQEIQSNINICRNINKKVPKIITENEIQIEISKISCEFYKIKPYPSKTIEEIEELAKNEAQRYARINATKNIFKRSAEIKKIANIKLNDFITLQKDKERNNEAIYLKNEEQVRIKKDAEYKTEYDNKCRPFVEKIIDDDNIINSNLTKLYSLNDKDLPPFSIAGTYSSNQSNTCTLYVELPSFDYIECRKLTQTGKVSSVMRSSREMEDDYYFLKNGLLLYIAAKVFNVNTCIKAIHIEAETKELDPETGKIAITNEGYYLIDRNSFSKINFSLAEPSAAISKYKTYLKPIAKPSTVKNKPLQKTAYKTPKLKSVKQKSIYEIKCYDELSKQSLSIIDAGIKALYLHYGDSILTESEKNRFSSAVKDIFPKNEAERQIVELLLSNNCFSKYIDSSEKQDAIKKIKEILSGNNLDSDIFLSNLESMLGEN